MKTLIVLIVILILSGCGKSEFELEKERLSKQMNDIRRQLDSAQMKVDSAMVEYDSLQKRIVRDSISVDSLIKKLTPFKK